MDAQPKVVQVRLSPEQVVEVPVVRWVDYPLRALVYAGEERRPLVVQQEAESGLYSVAGREPRRIHVRWETWGRVAVFVGSATALWVVTHYFPAHPPSRPVHEAPALETAPRPQPEPMTPVEEPRVDHPQVEPRQSPARAAVPPPHVERAPRRPAAARPAKELAAPAPRQPEAPKEVAGEPVPRPEVGTLRPVAHVQKPAPETEWKCECGRTFRSERELERHRQRIVYSCIRYPECSFTARTPAGVVAHYEAQREERGPCYSEAVRLMNRYKVVARPECRARAADPKLRVTKSVEGPAVSLRPGNLETEGPFRLEAGR